VFEGEECADFNSVAQSGVIQRFRDNDELRFCLRSIEKHAPWVRKIHIVLARNSPAPAWLNSDSSKLNILNERDILPSVQPNSETKKMGYHRIKGLADRFVTCDDDMFLGRDAFLMDFFDSDGVPLLNSVHTGWDGQAHLPIGWTKEGYSNAVESLDGYFYYNAGCKRLNPWKDMKDFMIEHGKGRKGKRKSPDVWINVHNVREYETLLSKIEDKKPKFYCINDDWDEDPDLYAKQMKNLHAFFLRMYPHKSSFEK